MGLGLQKNISAIFACHLIDKWLDKCVIQATRELRAMGVKSPIIGLTGNALNSDRNEFIAAGVDDFFTKPISRHQLVKLLEAYGLLPKAKDKIQVTTSLELCIRDLDSPQSTV